MSDSEHKKRLSVFTMLFTKYIYGEIIKLYTKAENTRSFQSKLYDIPSWDFERKQKNFNKFLKSSNTDNQTVYTLLEELIQNNINILCDDPVEFDTPDPSYFLYKIHKHAGKFFYENPLNLEENEKTNIKFIMNLVKTLVDKQTPISSICKVKNKEHISYDFNNQSHSYSHTTTPDNDSDSVSDNFSTELLFINSQDYKNEYYHSDHEQSEKEINFKINKKQHLVLPDDID